MNVIDGHYGQNRIAVVELDDSRRLSRLRIGRHVIRRNDIESVTEITQSTKGSGGSVVGGAILGGLIAGETGAIVGSLAGGQKGHTSTHTVLVKHRNGLQFTAACTAEELQLLHSAATFKSYERTPDKVDWDFLGGTKSSWDFLENEESPPTNPVPQVASQVKCPHCKGAVQNDPRVAGTVVSCPYCEGQFKMPPPPDAIV